MVFMRFRPQLIVSSLSRAPKPSRTLAPQPLAAAARRRSLTATLSFFSSSSMAGAAPSEEALRRALAERQAAVDAQAEAFYIPSFKFYRGVAGLYDYVPPGCAVKSNVLAFWRQVSEAASPSRNVVVYFSCLYRSRCCLAAAI